MNQNAKIFFEENAYENIDGLIQDCSNSIANALELLQSCTKPSISSAKSRPVQVALLSLNVLKPTVC